MIIIIIIIIGVCVFFVFCFFWQDDVSSRSQVQFVHRIFHINSICITERTLKKKKKRVPVAAVPAAAAAAVSARSGSAWAEGKSDDREIQRGFFLLQLGGDDEQMRVCVWTVEKDGWWRRKCSQWAPLTLQASDSFFFHPSSVSHTHTFSQSLSLTLETPSLMLNITKHVLTESVTTQ